MRSIAIVGAILTAMLAAPAAARDEDERVQRSEVMRHYDAGYDDRDPSDDWFFDYYTYSDRSRDNGYYAGYDEDADHFDWEEHGLFA